MHVCKHKHQLLLGWGEWAESLRFVLLGTLTRNTDQPISSRHLSREVMKKDKNSGSSWGSRDYKETKDTRQYLKKIRTSGSTGHPRTTDSPRHPPTPVLSGVMAGRAARMVGAWEWKRLCSHTSWNWNCPRCIDRVFQRMRWEIIEFNSAQHCIYDDMAMLCDLWQIDHSHTHGLLYNMGEIIIINYRLILRGNEIIHVKCLA